ncbi:MAG TPA: GNAT family N-acetyltransferase [Oculatellaceae cyanobacterium]
MKILFRQATQADIEFLDSIYRLGLQKHVERIYTWKPELFRQKFNPLLTQVIISDGIEVGMVTVKKQVDELYLGDLVILPEFQNQGIGSAVIKGVLKDASTEGVPVRLQVLKQNPAKCLYERLGFVIVTETQTHYIMGSGF